MDVLTSLLAREGFLPHGWCYTWTPGLLWPMVGADVAIAAAYFSIPLAILNFTRRRTDFSMKWVAWLFSGFIFACGLTHLMDVWTIWQPDYGVQLLTKLVTAGVSLLTAVALWRLIPDALQIPSLASLRSAIVSLESEVGRRRTAEEHLQDTQQSLAVTLASIGAGFIAADRDGRVTRMNPVAERILGWSEDEARGRGVFEVFQREGRPAADAAHNPVDLMVARDVTIDDVHPVVAIARDGRRTEIEVQAALTRAGDGEVRGMAMVLRDLTAQLRASTESNRLAAIVESCDDAIIGKDLDGRITNWNRAAETMFGYTAAEALGQPIQLLIPPEREAEEMRILQQLARDQRVPPFDTVRRARSGALLDVSVCISPIRDARGRVVGASKIARDVTRQRRAEAALRESEDRLRFTLDSAQIGTWELDLVNGGAQTSARHDRCFGYEVRQSDWSFERFIGHVHPDDRTAVRRQFEIATSMLRDWSVQCRVIWPDLSEHWISLHGCIRHQVGKPPRMQGIVSEVTAQKLAEEVRLTAQRLEAENRQILEASRMKSQFMANMSHELRTPLNAVIGFAELLQSGAVPPDSPKHREFLGHIGSSGRHLLQLINDVLDLSKVESGKLEFFPVAVDLPRLVRDVTGVLDAGRQAKDISISVDIDPDVATLELDPARLKQALFNYLSNALKFTPAGGRVALRALPEGADAVRIEVEDSGIGIAAADLPRLFTDFLQLDAAMSRRHEGTGLGLALTRRLVQAQGGRVGVFSTPGVGSLFFLVLGRRPGARVPRAAAGAPPQTGPLAQRVLVIEDDPAQQSRLARSLADAGFDVDVAGNREEALQQAAERLYGSITFGLGLPDAGGFDLLGRIRSGGPNRRAPVRGVTMPVPAGMQAHFPIVDVISKPIRTEEVVAAMRAFRGTAQRPTRVMVIDDDPLALELMRAALGGLGIVVDCWQDGREALSQIEYSHPDAIVLDLMMPGFDGFAVLDALSRTPVYCATPVFIWTSMLLTDAEFLGLQRSAAAILGKGGGLLEPLLDHLRRWRAPVRARLPS